MVAGQFAAGSESGFGFAVSVKVKLAWMLSRAMLGTYGAVAAIISATRNWSHGLAMASSNDFAPYL